MGAGWLIVHNPQWGVTVSGEGKVLTDLVVWEQVSSSLCLIKREFERLELKERAIQRQLLTHLGTCQLSLLTQDQLQEWLTWLKLQPSPADQAQELAQAEQLQQIALQVATDRAARKAQASVQNDAPSTQTPERSQLEIPDPQPPVAKEEGVGGREERAQIPMVPAARLVRRPIIKRRVVETATVSSDATSPPPPQTTRAVSSNPVTVAPEPQDFSDVLMAIMMAIQQLGWNQRQVQEELRALFKADLRQDQLTDGQLEDWLEYLQAQIDEMTERFKACWNQHKPSEFAPIDVITYERTESIMRLVQELGGIEKTCEIIASGLAYPPNDPFWNGRNIPFERACSHLIEWHEQRLATDTTPTSPPQQEYVSPFDRLSPEEKEQYMRQYANDPSWVDRSCNTDRRDGR